MGPTGELILFFSTPDFGLRDSICLRRHIVRVQHYAQAKTSQRLLGCVCVIVFDSFFFVPSCSVLLGQSLAQIHWAPRDFSHWAGTLSLSPLAAGAAAGALAAGAAAGGQRRPCRNALACSCTANVWPALPPTLPGRWDQTAPQSVGAPPPRRADIAPLRHCWASTVPAPAQRWAPCRRGVHGCACVCMSCLYAYVCVCVRACVFYTPHGVQPWLSFSADEAPGPAPMAACAARHSKTSTRALESE